jgi:hypothetical protein
MAAFTRTQSDGTWNTGYAVTPSDIADLERKAFQGINGDVGGSYTPTSELFIQGSSMVVSGPTEIRQRGIVTGAVVLYGTEFERFAVGHVNRSRTIWQPCSPFAVVGPTPWAVVPSINPRGAHAVASRIIGHEAAVVPEFVVELRVHNGATLSKARLRLKVTTPHSSAPAAMPKVRIGRMRYDGVVEYLTSGIDNYVSLPKANSGQDWYKDGDVQEFEIPCTQNNVIDISQYSYFANVVEESGIRGYPFEIDVFAAEDIQAASLTNQAIPPGTMSLFMGQNVASENGVYDAGGRAGIRLSPDFKNGMVFFVRSGDEFTGTYWQMSIPEPFTVDSSPIRFSSVVPRGTLFLGFLLDFTNITDNRFQ